MGTNSLDSLSCHSEQKEENNIDPDDGNSWACSACKLPIFSTPFKETTELGSSSSLYLHDKCSDLPQELENSVWRLSLMPNLHETRCFKCEDVCGNVMYRCHDRGCFFELDVKCARLIKTVHRSHEHRLMVIRSDSQASFACGACGTRHRPGLTWAQPVPLVYVCSPCGFWLHPHCASLPNAILLQHHHHHPHPLLLNYRWELTFLSNIKWYKRKPTCHCAICGGRVDSVGAYSCANCNYYVHIMCAVRDKQSFEAVRIGEARFPDLVHFPVPDEHTSVVRHITASSSYGDGEVLHQHPLILNHHHPDKEEEEEDDDDDDDDHPRPTCNACAQLISPPFYTCSECPNLFLHDCCARLPHKFTQNPSHVSLHLKGPPKSSIPPAAGTNCCRRLTNGFTYSDSVEYYGTAIDVACALMPASITHAAHATTHILYSSFHTIFPISAGDCHCCGVALSGYYYNCGTCQSFSIHASCARLPRTVRHVLDRHPLTLVTAAPSHRSFRFCDVCEEGLDDRRWYYACDECDQSFHVDCIPCVDNKSLINYSSAQIRLKCHKCPLTLVRGHVVRGRRCGYCGEFFKGYDTLAMECSKCYFWIHETCAKKLLE